MEVFAVVGGGGSGGEEVSRDRMSFWKIADFILEDYAQHIHCYLIHQRFLFCFETFHARLLSRWAALGSNRHPHIARNVRLIQSCPEIRFQGVISGG